MLGHKYSRRSRVKNIARYEEEEEEEHANEKVRHEDEEIITHLKSLEDKKIQQGQTITKP